MISFVVIPDSRLAYEPCRTHSLYQPRLTWWPRKNYHRNASKSAAATSSSPVWLLLKTSWQIPLNLLSDPATRGPTGRRQIHNNGSTNQTARLGLEGRPGRRVLAGGYGVAGIHWSTDSRESGLDWHKQWSQRHYLIIKGILCKPLYPLWMVIEEVDKYGLSTCVQAPVFGGGWAIFFFPPGRFSNVWVLRSWKWENIKVTRRVYVMPRLLICSLWALLFFRSSW